MANGGKQQSTGRSGAVGDVDDDAEAALELGRQISSQDGIAANAWFRAAVRAKGSSAMHQVIQYLEENPPQDLSRIGVWKRRACIALYPRVDAPYTRVAASLFSPLDERGMAVGEPDTHLIIQSQDPQAVGPAVQRAAERVLEVEKSLRLSAVEAHENGTHFTIESGPPLFGPMCALLDAVIVEMAGAGVRTAYIRPASAENWLPSHEPEPSFPEEIAQVVARAADDLSGEAAFEVARWCQENFFRHCGDVWFKRAASLARFDMMLRVIDDYAMRYADWNGDRLASWIKRSRNLEFPRVDAPNIHVHPTLFEPIVLDDCAGYGHDTSVQVRCAQPEAAALALARAADRFSRVTLDGREFATYDELLAAEPADDDHEGWLKYYTPNFVGEVSLDENGYPALSMDWKDHMAPTMARTMIHILIDELTKAGVVHAHLRPHPTDL